MVYQKFDLRMASLICRTLFWSNEWGEATLNPGAVFKKCIKCRLHFSAGHGWRRIVITLSNHSVPVFNNKRYIQPRILNYKLIQARIAFAFPNWWVFAKVVKATMNYFTGQDMHLIEFDGNGSKYVLIIGHFHKSR